jgi:hypothetical protein
MVQLESLAGDINFEQGANLNRAGHDRKTPLDVAEESGVDDLVSWLRGQGAQPA